MKHSIVLVVLSLSTNHTILFGKHSQNSYAKIAKTRIFVRIKPLWGRNVWKFNSITNRDVFQDCPQVIDSNDQAKFLFKSYAKSNKHKNNVAANLRRQSFLDDQPTSSRTENVFHRNIV